MDTKSSDNKITLLHYLIRMLIENDKVILLKEIVDSFKGAVTDACRVNLPILEAELNSLDRTLKSLKKTEYPSHLEAMISQAGLEVRDLFVNLKSTIQLYQETLVKYAEISLPSSVAADGDISLPTNQLPDCPDFFNTFRGFAVNLEKCLTDVQRIMEAEARELKQANAAAAAANTDAVAAEKNQQVSPTKNVNASLLVDLSESGGDQKGVMDSLLDSLRTKANNNSNVNSEKRATRRRTAKLKVRRIITNPGDQDVLLQQALDNL